MNNIPKYITEYGKNIKSGYKILRTMFCGEPKNGKYELSSRSKEDKMFLPLIAISVGGFLPEDVDRICSQRYFDYLSSVTKSEADASALIESNLNQYRDKLCKTIMKCYNLASSEINQYDTSNVGHNVEVLAAKNAKMESILNTLNVKIISPFNLGEQVVVNGDVFREIDYNDINQNRFNITKVVGKESGKKYIDPSSTYGCEDVMGNAIVKSHLILREAKVSGAIKPSGHTKPIK